MNNEPSCVMPLCKDAYNKESVSWAFYDFANSAYSLLIITFVFPIFFREVIAGSEHGDFWWGLAISVSILIGGILAPVIGAMADYDAKKKRKFIGFALTSMMATALLYFSGPGMLAYAFLVFVIANICFEVAQTLYDSFLLHVTSEETAGRISGLGWGLGYLGGVIAMLLFKPLYEAGYDHMAMYKLTFPLTALFFFIFALPAFIFIKEHKRIGNKARFTKLVKIGFVNAAKTLKDIRRHKQIAWFLVGFYLMNDALVTVFAFVPIFAKATLQMSFGQIATILLIIQLIGFPSAAFFGWLSDKKGSKKILLMTIIVWGLIVLGISLAASTAAFYIMAVLSGLVIGSSQAIARSWFSRIIPKDKTCEFFGFNGFASKIAATTGPLFFGIISVVTASQRLAMGSLVIYFIIAFMIFAQLKEEPEQMHL